MIILRKLCDIPFLSTDISVLLSAIQLMGFNICTGFGDSEGNYGGTSDDPFMGLFQVNVGGHVI